MHDAPAPEITEGRLLLDHVRLRLHKQVPRSPRATRERVGRIQVTEDDLIGQLRELRRDGAELLRRNVSALAADRR
jgi:hypothetical protein